MAHLYPECGQLCHCTGEIEETVPDDEMLECTHCKECQDDDKEGDSILGDIDLVTDSDGFCLDAEWDIDDIFDDLF